MKLLAGSSNPLLANHISTNAGVALSNLQLKKFADNEVSCEIDENIRGEDVFIIQSTSNPATVSYTHLTLPTICSV